MMERERFTALAQRFIDGTIDNDEAKELHQAIESSVELRDLLRAQVAMHAVIERTYRRRNPAVSRRVQAALRDPSQKKGAITRIMEKLDPKRPIKKSIPLRIPETRSSRRTFFFAAAAIVVTVLVSAVVIRALRPKVDPDEVAWALPATAKPVAKATISSGFALVRRNDTSLRLTKERTLIAGDVVATFKTDTLTLTYPDATAVKTAGETHFVVQPDAAQETFGIALKLTQGELNAKVSPQQADTPMAVITPHGRATILGTEFSLSATKDETKLDVSQGKVRLARPNKTEFVIVERGQTAVLAPGVLLETGPSTRDPALWPFNAQSPWNMPLGSGAKFVPVETKYFGQSRGAGVAVDRNSIPIYIGTLNDPNRVFYRSVRNESKQLRLPVGAAPEPGDNRLLNFIDEHHFKVYELVGVEIETDGTIHLKANSYFNTIHRLGVYSDNKPHGSRAYGGSSLGGIVRKGELIAGIRHALGISVQASTLNANAPGGKPYVWPACYAPPGWETKYGQEGNLHLGSLLAIPPTVDLKKIGVGSSGPAFEIARALQDYGAYVIDHQDDAPNDLTFFVEPIAKNEVPKELSAQLALIIRNLKLVTNNSETNVGGGGTPRRQLAPPFAKEFVEKLDPGGQF